MNIWEELYKYFCKYKGKIALSGLSGEVISYNVLTDYVYGQAEKILNLVTPKSRIAIVCSNSYREAINILAGFASGCTVIPVSYKYGEKLCKQIISLSQPDLVITDNGCKNLVLDDHQTIYHKVLIADEFLEGKKNIIPHIDSNDIALIMFTSGTTGVPKGVMLSHGNILSNLYAINQYFKINEHDHILISRPLYHVAVMTGEYLISLLKGLKISFYDEAFSPKRLINYINSNQCTVMCATPTLYYYISLAGGKTSITIRKAAISGERLTKQVANKIMDAFPYIDFYHVYGLTEASPRVTYLEPKYFREKVGSIGKPLHNISTKIIDENGNETKAYEIGELVISGPNIMQGYWNDPELTATKVKSGWLYTGDMSYKDEEGFIYIVGRKDNMIIRAGMNIYPQEIENALMSEPIIKEVLVYGVDDERFGQRINAEIVLKDDANATTQDIIDICKRLLPEYQWPTGITIVKELKKNASGKIIRQR